MKGGTTKSAILYRMVMPEHTCPYGLKARWLLKENGYEVDDRILHTREEVEAFKAEHGVESTPQVFIGERRIGGYDGVRRFFGQKGNDPDAASYVPIAVVFGSTALMALALSYAVLGNPFTAMSIEWFISLSMMILGMLKLQDIESFSTMFLNYDLLARRWVPYAYIYPFAEFGAGALMVAGVLSWISIPVAFLIGVIGVVSVFKAVYIDKRELTCACLGGNTNVPLGFISFTENIAMVAMAVWMAVMVGM